MPSYTRKDGTHVKYNSTESSLKWYHSHNAEMYKCDVCNKEIKLVSKSKHDQGKAHTRAVVLATMHQDNGTPRVDVESHTGTVVSSIQLTYSISRDERNRDETTFERDAQNAHYNAFMLTHPH